MGGEKQYFRCPYIHRISNNLKHILKKVDINLAFYSILPISCIYSNLKQKHALNDISEVVYKVPCSDCDMNYIGTTGNRLAIRLRQHVSDCGTHNRNKKNKTALAQHHFSEGHKLDFDSVSILDIESNYKKRYISEALHIKSTRNVMNFKTDTQNLSVIYAGLLA